MTEPAGESSHWVAANANARLGQPIAPGERHRLAKRVAAAICRPFVRHQTVYNLELLAELVTIRDSLVSQTRSLGELTTEQVDVLSSQISELGVLLGVTNARLDEAMINRDLVHQEVELAHRQALDRVDEAVDGIRREIGDLVRRAERLEAEIERARGRVPPS